ncbi:collagen alpha-1(I) chain-like [Eubalaena glacialis]|uniref:collagen alpha-1(I) chain-like n=1 Tax=Eubalaena glacialis TaxID=27606 RepID=UPI002A59CA22|nr:collagen alpha-1(I) chain-like [Eubalaena glacialis]
MSWAGAQKGVSWEGPPGAAPPPGPARASWEAQPGPRGEKEEQRGGAEEVVERVVQQGRNKCWPGRQLPVLTPRDASLPWPEEDKFVAGLGGRGGGPSHPAARPHRGRPTSPPKFAPARGSAAARPGLRTEGGKEGGERQRDGGTGPGSRRGRERASQRAREQARGPRRGLTMARGEARTREGEATLGSRSPRATGQPPSPVPFPTARCLGSSYLGGGGGRAPGCGLRRSGGGGRASGGGGRAGGGQGPRLTGRRLPWHGRPAPGRSATSAAPAGKVAAAAGPCGDVLEREGGGRREAAGGGTGGPRRRGRRRGAGGGLPPSSLPRCFPHSRPPSKPLSPPRPQVRGASCQAGRARRGEGAAGSRRWAGGGEEGRAARPGERAPGGRGRWAAAEPRASSAAPSLAQFQERAGRARRAEALAPDSGRCKPGFEVGLSPSFPSDVGRVLALPSASGSRGIRRRPHRGLGPSSWDNLHCQAERRWGP